MKGFPHPIEAISLNNAIYKNVIINIQTVAEWLPAQFYLTHKRKGIHIENTPSLQLLEMDWYGEQKYKLGAIATKD